LTPRSVNLSGLPLSMSGRSGHRESPERIRKRYGVSR
jgi:hypothetical protein